VSAKLATGDAALALNGDQWLALAGVFSGVLVGGGSLVFAYFNGRSERQHGERLARSSRLHDQRFAAYKEIARLLERQRLYLTQTEPFIGPKPDPPPPLDDEEWAGVSGLAAISPSQDALTALENASQKTSDFEIAVFTYRQINARPAAAGWTRIRTRSWTLVGRWTQHATGRSKRSQRHSERCAKSLLNSD
jgi:hypothetical protein